MAYTILDDLALIRRGVELAEMREKVPSYRMELQGVLQMIDELRPRLEKLKQAADGRDDGVA
jgi:FtsZ-binding cell division protein ZapB